MILKVCYGEVFYSLLVNKVTIKFMYTYFDIRLILFVVVVYQVYSVG